MRLSRPRLPSESPLRCPRPPGRCSSASCARQERLPEFFDRYFDDRGYLECVERWGGDDGPDDAIENVNDWPVLYAWRVRVDPGAIQESLGRPPPAVHRGPHEGRAVRARRDVLQGIPRQFDWFHHGEGLSVFNLEGLCDPHDSRYRQRVTRFAGFYLGDDPGAPNYDPKVKIIRSLFNGSRGPLLRKATALDWTGDPIEVEGRFRLGHGEHTYAQMLEHFKDYNEIVGDHPLNLGATNLALNQA